MLLVDAHRAAVAVGGAAKGVACREDAAAGSGAILSKEVTMRENSAKWNTMSASTSASTSLMFHELP